MRDQPPCFSIAPADGRKLHLDAVRLSHRCYAQLPNEHAGNRSMVSRHESDTRIDGDKLLNLNLGLFQSMMVSYTQARR